MFRADRSGAFAPYSVARNVSALGRQFRVGRQEDSHEFVRCLLDRMCRTSLRVAGVKENAPGRLDETTPIHDVFGGYFRNQVHCSTCGFDSNSYESFLDLSLEVGRDLPSVTAALRHFAKPETLVREGGEPRGLAAQPARPRAPSPPRACAQDAKNMWKCPRCKVPVQAVKQMTVYKVRPPSSPPRALSLRAQTAPPPARRPRPP